MTEDILNTPAGLVQLVVSSPEIRPYFHFDLRPGPLAVADASGQMTGLDRVSTPNGPVSVAGEDAPDAFIVTSAEIAETSATLTFAYPREGIVGRAVFSRDSAEAAWHADTIEFHER